MFKSLSDTVTPQGVLCLIRIKESTLEEMIPEEKPALLMILGRSPGSRKSGYDPENRGGGRDNRGHPV